MKCVTCTISFIELYRLLGKHYRPGIMADNYLEKKYEDLQERIRLKKAKEQRLRQAAWKKRMEAYRKKLEEQNLENDKI